MRSMEGKKVSTCSNLVYPGRRKFRFGETKLFCLVCFFRWCNDSHGVGHGSRGLHSNIDNQRNGLEMQAKALMLHADATSVIWPDTLYFGTL